eukprot:SAG11_NODE_7032_length_1205_cov_1.446655_2_plen_101_part_01
MCRLPRTCVPQGLSTSAPHSRWEEDRRDLSLRVSAQIFKPGAAQISVLQGGKELLAVTMPLTPGPLVVALRGAASPPPPCAPASPLPCASLLPVRNSDFSS